MPEIAAESLQRKRPLDLFSCYLIIGPVQFFSLCWTVFNFFLFLGPDKCSQRGKVNSDPDTCHFTLHRWSLQQLNFSFLICPLQLWSHFPSTSWLGCLRGRRSWCLGGARCLTGLRLNRGAAGLPLHKFSHSARFGFQSRNLSLFMQFNANVFTWRNPWNTLELFF